MYFTAFDIEARTGVDVKLRRIIFFVMNDWPSSASVCDPIFATSFYENYANIVIFLVFSFTIRQISVPYFVLIFHR
jgi:hypothetical protein